MTAITQVYNYTVRVVTQSDVESFDWHTHVEMNHSSEIALDRVYRWHNQGGELALDLGALLIKKQADRPIYYALLHERVNSDNHVLATFKLIQDPNHKDVDVGEVFQHMLTDFQQKISQ
ncbi:cytoplasmic protein [Shewanella corallii]|uniref:Cytoplasmic protein n=2 Tax=Shewanella TaxID=22 RepID=A0ABT0N4D4_9GAMM|nr:MULTISPECIES: cytoplasmic protein [Shewanella]MCL1036801.1 cytoplasmic protein [Shewanella submarina]MCL2913302.1 cytoplasmic protein [Shewanella corallii]